MGKHSSPAPAAQNNPTESNPAKSNPARRLLIAFLALGLLGTIAGLITQWPDSTPPPVSDAFTQNSGMTGELVEATVFAVQPGMCNSPSIGQTFATAPVNDPLQPQDCTQAIVDITSGADAGQRTLLEVRPDSPGNPDLQPDEHIVLSHHGAYAFQDYSRASNLWIWLGVTAALICLVGAMRGVRSLLGLALTFAVVLLFLIPGIAHGGNAVTLAVTTGAAVLFAVLFLVHGFNWKTTSAMGGTLIALGIAAGLSQWAISGANLRGLGDENNLNILIYLPGIDIRGLMLAGMIIGALGVLGDVTIAQASTINELHELNPAASGWELFTSAMKVGRDHIASMVYTLVLSYTGVALPTLLLLSLSGRPLVQILTSDVMATEILRSVTGAVALILAVPLTSLIAAWTVPSRTR